MSAENVNKLDFFRWAAVLHRQTVRQQIGHLGFKTVMQKNGIFLEMDYLFLKNSPEKKMDYDC